MYEYSIRYSLFIILHYKEIVFYSAVFAIYLSENSQPNKNSCWISLDVKTALICSSKIVTKRKCGCSKSQRSEKNFLVEETSCISSTYYLYSQTVDPNYLALIDIWQFFTIRTSLQIKFYNHVTAAIKQQRQFIQHLYFCVQTGD